MFPLNFVSTSTLAPGTSVGEGIYDHPPQRSVPYWILKNDKIKKCTFGSKKCWFILMITKNIIGAVQLQLVHLSLPVLINLSYMDDNIFKNIVTYYLFFRILYLLTVQTFNIIVLLISLFRIQVSVLSTKHVKVLGRELQNHDGVSPGTQAFQR